MKIIKIEIIDPSGLRSLFNITASDEIVIYLDEEDIALSDVHSIGRHF